MIIDDTPDEHTPDFQEDDDVKTLEGFQFDRGLNGALARLVLRLRTSEIDRQRNAGALVSALADCKSLSPTMEAVREVMAMQEELAVVSPAPIAPSTEWMTVPRGMPNQLIQPLHDLLCALIGTHPEHFLKYDPDRKVVDYAANINHLSCVVDLTKFMSIPGSGWEWISYYVESPAGKRVRAAKKALITATDDIQLLGGGGMAHDTAIAAFDAAKKEFAEAEAALLKYEPGTVPYEGPA